MDPEDDAISQSLESNSSFLALAMDPMGLEGAASAPQSVVAAAVGMHHGTPAPLEGHLSDTLIVSSLVVKEQVGKDDLSTFMKKV